MNTPPSRLRRLILAAGPAFLFSGCGKKPAPAPPAVTRAWLDAGSDFLTPGAPPPDWSLLDAWQERVTVEQFERLLRNVVSDGTQWFREVALNSETAPATGGPWLELRFAKTGAPATAGPRYWRRREELPPLRDPARPLEDLHVALDPGHIGGVWAEMEQRYVKPGDAPPVKEGDITLRTARILAPLLEEMGARVSLVRERLEPLTTVRPEQLRDAARASLEQEGAALSEEAIRKEAERLFYRTAEIRARGKLVNETLRPDLVLCLHYNGDGSGKTFSKANHLHVLAHGSIAADESRYDDQRLDGLLRLLEGIPDAEIPLCTAVARRMAEATGLPPYTYFHGARRVPDQPYVWIRNLLANRVYRCPVVFLEPYVMNNAEVIERIHAGDYEGTAQVAGQERRSIFREYAGGVAEGLRDYFSARK